MMENKDKYLTVTQIAKRGNATRNKVWAIIRKNGIEPVSREDKPFKFDSEMVLELLNKQDKKHVKNNKNAVSDDILKVLENQLEIKDKQIAELNKTIDFLKNENVGLRVEGSKQRKLLEDTQQKLDSVSESETKTEKKKRHFWDFLR